MCQKKKGVGVRLEGWLDEESPISRSESVEVGRTEGDCVHDLLQRASSVRKSLHGRTEDGKHRGRGFGVGLAVGAAEIGYRV